MEEYDEHCGMTLKDLVDYFTAVSEYRLYIALNGRITGDW
jgi:hypothetical protein